MSQTTYASPASKITVPLVLILALGVLDPEVVSAMLAHARRDDDALERLTPHQHEVRAVARYLSR